VLAISVCVISESAGSSGLKGTRGLGGDAQKDDELEDHSSSARGARFTKPISTRSFGSGSRISVPSSLSLPLPLSLTGGCLVWLGSFFSNLLPLRARDSTNESCPRPGRSFDEVSLLVMMRVLWHVIVVAMRTGQPRNPVSVPPERTSERERESQQSSQCQFARLT
jgi:hypothetical protein